MNTEHERLIAAHKAYKVVARREKKELQVAIDKLQRELDSLKEYYSVQADKLKKTDKAYTAIFKKYEALVLDTVGQDAQIKIYKRAFSLLETL